MRRPGRAMDARVRGCEVTGPPPQWGPVAFREVAAGRADGFRLSGSCVPRGVLCYPGVRWGWNAGAVIRPPGGTVRPGFRRGGEIVRTAVPVRTAPRGGGRGRPATLSGRDRNVPAALPRPRRPVARGGAGGEPGGGAVTGGDGAHVTGPRGAVVRRRATARCAARPPRAWRPERHRTGAGTRSRRDSSRTAGRGEDAVRSPSSGADPRTRLPRPRKPSVTDRPSCPPCLRSPRCHPWSGIGSGRFPIAAAITSGNRSGVQANAGVPSAASAAACSLS